MVGNCLFNFRTEIRCAAPPLFLITYIFLPKKILLFRRPLATSYPAAPPIAPIPIPADNAFPKTCGVTAVVTL